jgi:CBS domain-containing protein
MMRAPISIVLERKGRDVATIGPSATVADAARRLTERTIGALVVTEDERTVLGVISERDIVRRIARDGEAALASSIHSVMSSDVTTCTPGSPVDELYRVLTQQRIRHVPVVEAGRLVGIVSIGDLVKWRMDELAEESHHLQSYVQGSY